MKKYRSLWVGVISGGCCAALALFAVNALIRSLSILVTLLGDLFSLSADDSAYAVAVLAQLREARIQLPIALSLLLGVLGGVALWLLSRRWRKTAVCLAVLLFLSLVVVVFLCTQVNGIKIGLFLSALLPLLPHLL